MKAAHASALHLGVLGMSLSYPEVRILQWTLKACGVRKMIEIGTLTGFSGLGLLACLPSDGQLWTFEKDLARADLSAKAFAQALTGSTKQAFVVRGDARVELEKIVDQGPFDGIFIDGNKAAYGDYLLWAEKNLRKGGVIIADNIFLGGSVYGNVDNSVGNRYGANQVQVMQQFNKRLCDPALFDTCLVPTEEGMLLARKLV